MIAWKVSWNTTVRRLSHVAPFQEAVHDLLTCINWANKSSNELPFKKNVSAVTDSACKGHRAMLLCIKHGTNIHLQIRFMRLKEGVNLSSSFRLLFPPLCLRIPTFIVLSPGYLPWYQTERGNAVSMLWRILYPWLKNVDKNCPEQAHLIHTHVITIHTSTHSHQAEKHTGTVDVQRLNNIFIVHTHTHTHLNAYLCFQAH